jgi:hypothetical protein
VSEPHENLGIAGPDFESIGDLPLGGEVFLVFTLREGRIVRIHDYRTREEARRAAGLKTRSTPRRPWSRWTRRPTTLRTRLRRSPPK